MLASMHLLTEMQFDGNVTTGLVLYNPVIEIRWDREEGLHDGLTFDVSASKIGRSTISIH